MNAMAVANVSNATGPGMRTVIRLAFLTKSVVRIVMVVTAYNFMELVMKIAIAAAEVVR